MTAVLEFIDLLHQRMRDAQIRFALTSGMACVRFGLQQNTKDSDWILQLDGIGRFLDIMVSFEHGEIGRRVSYRGVFGAPLDAAWMKHGWTSHLMVLENEGAIEHHVDIFCRPPRVRELETEPGVHGLASRHVVAQMKKTDRAKDWPMVDGLGWQLALARNPVGLLHLQDPAKLQEEWRRTDPRIREEMARRRPLLSKLDDDPDLDRLHGLIRLERLVWECVNEVRYGTYQRTWKDFYRRWRDARDHDWPTTEPFTAQHARLVEAATTHELPRDPLGDANREVVLDTGSRRAAARAFLPLEAVLEVAPPLSEVLP